MDLKLEKELYDKYPSLFKQKNWSIKDSCLPFGAEHGDGWFRLLERLCDFVDFNIKKNKMPPIEWTQLKEKFASARWYYDGGNEYLSGAIAFAEFLSGYVCEQCGDFKTAKTRGKGWLYDMCDECWEKHNAEK